MECGKREDNDTTFELRCSVENMTKVFKTAILEVDLQNTEHHLTLMDGSKWFVNPGDLPTIATWIPMTGVELKKNNASMFNFDITNISGGITIRAMRVPFLKEPKEKAG